MSFQTIDAFFFYLINHFHSPLLDVGMKSVSNGWYWLPFVILILLTFYQSRIKDGYSPQAARKQLWVFLLLSGACIGLSNTITSEVLKPIVKRYRPCQPASGMTEVHTVDGHCGGKYGFASSHAANYFAGATLLFFAFRKKKWRYLLFFCAACVAYSRIYLGVHYPSDVIVGGFIGFVCSFLLWKMYHAFFAQTLSLHE